MDPFVRHTFLNVLFGTFILWGSPYTCSQYLIHRALCLPTQDSSVTGEVELVGWRISSVVGSLSQSLVSLKTTIVPDCGAGEERLCTSEDTRCQGDTGAPLVKSDNTLVGAMTGGTGCSKYDYGVFTKISSRFLGNQYISYCSTI